jgi:hypothetical protein
MLLRAGIALAAKFLDDNPRERAGINGPPLPGLEHACHKFGDRINAITQSQIEKDAFIGFAEPTNVFRPKRKIVEGR